MKDYILTHASSQSPRSLLEHIKLWRQNWRTRQVIHELLLRSDRHLTDAVFTRSQLNNLLTLPFRASGDQVETLESAKMR